MCSNRQICPPGCPRSDKAPIRMQGCGDVQLSISCLGCYSVQLHCSWKKPNSLIQVLFYPGSITLQSSLWHRQVTEAANGLRSAAKVGTREEGISQQVFEKIYQKKEPLAPAAMCHMWAHMRVRHLSGSGTTGNETFFFRMYSLYLDITLLRKLWNWSPLKKVRFVSSVVPDNDITRELYLLKIYL